MQFLNILVIPSCIWSVISIFMIYSSTNSPGWACEKESLCLCGAGTGLAGLSCRLGGTNHPVKGTTLLSLGPRWCGNPTGPSLALWCCLLVPCGGDWGLWVEASASCWAPAGIQWWDQPSLMLVFFSKVSLLRFKSPIESLFLSIL